LLLSVSLGVRVGPTELLALKWADADLERGIVRVWSANKNPKRPFRDIPIRADILHALKIWKEEDKRLQPETIVHYKGNPIQSLKRAWATCKEKANIARRLRPYDLRHAFATYAIDAGADLKDIADIMGHADATMVLRHYQHGKEESRRAAVESIPDLPLYVPKACPQQKKDSQQSL